MTPKKGSTARGKAVQPSESVEPEAISESDSADSSSEAEAGEGLSESGSEIEVDTSGEEDEEEESAGEEEDDSDNDALDRALVDLVSSRDAEKAEEPEQQAINGKAIARLQDASAAAGREVDAATDSSEDEREPRNTIGEVPLEWYKDEDHIGYDHSGKKLLRKAQKDRLDALLAKNDLPDQWRTIYDEYNDEEIVLSKEEIELLQRIRQGRFPHVEVNPYEPEADWFTREQEIHPLSSAPEPKRRFMPSKWEEKKIVKLVRALRKGWIKREKEEPKEPEIYLMWADDGNVPGKAASGLQYLPATKSRLPGHEESYNPPKEYLPSEEEKNAYELLDSEDKPEFVPRLYGSLRKVPAYNAFIKERFERCLDLYLCPRKPRKRPFVKDPQTLVPRLPKPQDLQPFPTTLLLQYLGHKAAVRSISPDQSGQWLASGSADATVKVWEVATGRCMRTWKMSASVKCVAWCPNQAVCLLAAVVEDRVLLLSPGLGTEEVEANTAKALQPPESSSEKQACRWQSAESTEGGLELVHQFAVGHVTWHSKGDYFASVAPTGNTLAVLVHQLSKKATQNPFRKSRGRVVRVAFHPAKPFFFVATLNHVYVYNLAKQELAKKLKAGSSNITSLAIHSSGDHVLVGKQDNRLCWFDLDLSTKPYKAMRYHEKPLEAVAFHRRYPLFASASSDATVHVFHGMVYQDYLTNPLIVPVKILRGHKVVEHLGVLDAVFHPMQPWIFSAGGDSTISLFTN